MSTNSDPSASAGNVFHTGRQKPDGSWPSRAEWERNRATNRDRLFESEEAARAYFAARIEAIEAMMNGADRLSNRIILERLMKFVENHPDLIPSLAINSMLVKAREPSRFKASAVIYNPNPDSKVATVNMSVSDRANMGSDTNRPFAQGVTMTIMQGVEPYIGSHGIKLFLSNNPDWLNQPEILTTTDLKTIADLEAGEDLLDLVGIVAAELFHPDEGDL